MAFVEEVDTFGKRLVGITFNPSKDPRVDRAKEICAELADMVYNKSKDEKQWENGGVGHIIYEQAIGEILNAQMNVVKFLTLK